MLEEAFASKTRDEWEAIFALTDACVTPVLDYVEAASHPVNAERKAMLQDGRWLHPQIAPRLATQSQASEFVIATCGGDYAAVLAEAGLRVLVLEAGPELSSRQAFGSEPLNTARRVASIASGQQRLQRHHPGFWKHNPQLFVDERLNPYSTPEDAPFLWSRGRQVGGKSLTWGGITLRLSDYEFGAAERDGQGAGWPIGSAELAPYYTRLEQLLEVHGACDGLPQLPDGHFQAPLPFTPGERHLQRRIGNELGLPLIHSRGFNLKMARLRRCSMRC